jgi:hypothetical protein
MDYLISVVSPGQLDTDGDGIGKKWIICMSTYNQHIQISEGKDIEDCVTKNEIQLLQDNGTHQ